MGITTQIVKPVRSRELLAAVAAMCEMAISPPNQSELPQLSSNETAGSLKILLAEDNRVNQAVATRLLQRRGHVIVVANNGKEALSLLEDQSFDLVLMDVQMPEMDGITATAEIRRREESTERHIPIIAMTAHAMKGDRERCIAAGMDGYVSKPVNGNELAKTIELVLNPLQTAHA